MIINEPAPDWLTLTTFDETVAYGLETVLDNCSVAERKPAKVMQYEGWRRAQLFLGRALQNGIPHVMFTASGMGAAIAFNHAYLLPVKCTRIDLQITVPCPRDYDSRLHYDTLSSNPKLPDVAIVQSGDGLDTIYIGRRISRRFFRLYVKPDAKGARFLRFEVEYKRDIADSVWDRLRLEPDATSLMGDFLASELVTIDNHQLPGIDAIARALIAYRNGDRPRDNRTSSSGRTLRWLMKQVNPAVMRAMADHDQSAGVRELVRVWSAWADRLDAEDTHG